MILYFPAQEAETNLKGGEAFLGFSSDLDPG